MRLFDKQLIREGLLNSCFDFGPDSTWFIMTSINNRTSCMPFYLIEWGHFFAGPKYCTRRKNDRYLLFYTLSGEGELNYAGKTYTLNANTVALIWCGQEHEYHTTGQEPWNFRWIHFSGVCVHEYYQILGDSQPIIVDITNDRLISNQICLITDSDHSNSPSQNLLISKVFIEIMTSLWGLINVDNESLFNRNIHVVDEAINYMECHFTENITLDIISNQLFLSKYYFSRIFKQITGNSPYQYLINLRVSKAKELLALTNCPLAEIAELSGFSDVKNLIYLFKRQVGMTPGEYRRTARE